MEEIPDFGDVEDENTLDEHNVGWIDGRKLLATARVLAVVVDGHFAAFAVQNVNERLVQQLIVERVYGENIQPLCTFFLINGFLIYVPR